MKKRFVVLVNDQNQEQEKSFIAYLNRNNCGWWHWLENSWLIVDLSGILTPDIIRDEVNKISPNSYSLVVEVPMNKNWSGFGPNSENSNMFKWLHESWDQ